jgi:hypothetical protein
MKRRTVLGGVAGAALITAGIAYSVAGGGPAANGPVEAGLPGGYGQALDPGEAYSAGHVLLENHGDDPAVVESVRLVGMKGPMEFLGVRTRPVPGPDAEGTFVGVPGFPPEGFQTKPLAEQNVVPVPTEFTEEGGPAQVLELALGVRSTGAGVGRAWGVEVAYRVGDKRYKEKIQARIYLCAPLAAFKGDVHARCPGEFRDDFSDEVFDPPKRAG